MKKLTCSSFAECQFCSLPYCDGYPYEPPSCEICGGHILDDDEQTTLPYHMGGDRPKNGLFNVHCCCLQQQHDDGLTTPQVVDRLVRYRQKLLSNRKSIDEYVYRRARMD